MNKRYEDLTEDEREGCFNDYLAMIQSGRDMDLGAFLNLMSWIRSLSCSERLGFAHSIVAQVNISNQQDRHDGITRAREDKAESVIHEAGQSKVSTDACEYRCPSTQACCRDAP